MSKDKVKKILIVLIVLILCLNVWVYAAYVLSATDVNYTKSNGTTVSVKTALDELYTKVPTHEIGDEVTVGGEQFYVLDWDNRSDSALLIAKYNLNSTGTAQSTSYVGISFASNGYWKGGNPISPFNLNDFIGFTSTDAMGLAKTYGITKGAISSRLLTYEEANSFRSRWYAQNKVDEVLGGPLQKRYWCSSIQNVDAENIWVVDGSRYQMDDRFFAGWYYRGDAGVRPVITVLKSNIS